MSHYDICPGNKISETVAEEIDQWLIEMVGASRVHAGLIKTELGIVQRISFTSEEDRNLFALYVSGLDLAKK